LPIGRYPEIQEGELLPPVLVDNLLGQIFQRLDKDGWRNSDLKLVYGVNKNSFEKFTADPWRMQIHLRLNKHDTRPANSAFVREYMHILFNYIEDLVPSIVGGDVFDKGTKREIFANARVGVIEFSSSSLHNLNKLQRLYEEGGITPTASFAEGGVLPASFLDQLRKDLGRKLTNDGYGDHLIEITEDNLPKESGEPPLTTLTIKLSVNYGVEYDSRLARAHQSQLLDWLDNELLGGTSLPNLFDYRYEDDADFETGEDETEVTYVAVG